MPQQENRQCDHPLTEECLCAEDSVFPRPGVGNGAEPDGEKETDPCLGPCTNSGAQNGGDTRFVHGSIDQPSLVPLFLPPPTFGGDEANCSRAGRGDHFTGACDNVGALYSCACDGCEDYLKDDPDFPRVRFQCWYKARQPGPGQKPEQ